MKQKLTQQEQVRRDKMKDLMDMGVPQGKEIGQILSWLLDQVLEDPQLNECETLTRMAEEKRDAK